MTEPKKTVCTADPKLLEWLEKARKVRETWPEWQKAACKAALLIGEEAATRETPRK